MKLRSLITIAAIIFIVASCGGPKPIDMVIDDALSFSVKQYTLMAEQMKDKPGLLPRTTDTTGKLITSNSAWWCSGFVPGSLWYLYEYSKDDKLKEYAKEMTSRLEKEKYNTGTHDLGFMLYCSFGERTQGNK